MDEQKKQTPFGRIDLLFAAKNSLINHRVRIFSVILIHNHICNMFSSSWIYNIDMAEDNSYASSVNYLNNCKLYSKLFLEIIWPMIERKEGVYNDQNDHDIHVI